MDDTLDVAIAKLEQEVTRVMRERQILLEAAHLALEFAADQEDVVDGSYGIPQPNQAMTVASALRRAIAKAEAA